MNLGWGTASGIPPGPGRQGATPLGRLDLGRPLAPDVIVLGEALGLPGDSFCSVMLLSFNLCPTVRLCTLDKKVTSNSHILASGQKWSPSAARRLWTVCTALQARRELGEVSRSWLPLPGLKSGWAVGARKITEGALL